MIALGNIQALGASIELEEETDVAVVGGTAGWATAYASAGKGSRTTIVESLPFLGGTMTGTMVLGSAGFRHQGMATGHAARAAAALAVQKGTTPRDLNVEVLQTALRSQAAII